MESKNSHYVLRGEIYLYNFGEEKGSVQAGMRPVLVLQCDDINYSSTTVIVAAITSSLKKTKLDTHIQLPPMTGLDMPSAVMLEQIRTVNVSDLHTYCGTLEDEPTWKLINIAIRKTFGITRRVKCGPREGMCLCSRCVEYYSYSPEYYVKRLTPPDGVMDTCSKCNFRRGFDYMVSVRDPYLVSHKEGRV